MNRHGQIFLIMTILVITFMMGISSVLLQVERSNYSEVVPDSDNVMIAWQNAYDSIVQILDVELSQQSSVPAGIVDITTELTYLENYLNEQGLSAIVESRNGVPLYANDNPLTPLPSATTNILSITGDFYLHLQSGNIEIDQLFTITITYTTTSPSADTVIVKRDINTEVFFVQSATLSGPVITYRDFLNGKYVYDASIGSGTTINILTPTMIQLNIISF